MVATGVVATGVVATGVVATGVVGRAVGSGSGREGLLEWCTAARSWLREEHAGAWHVRVAEWQTR